MNLTGYILIGCPGSGKSTFAKILMQQNSHYRLVSTDKIREKLFGTEIIQGDWRLIETEVFRQIEHHFQAGNSIIYDATNAKVSWRIDLLTKLRKYKQVNWIGWYLKTPLETCKINNRNRQRQVPELVIEEMNQSLTKFPPSITEGFTIVNEIPYSKKY